MTSLGNVLSTKMSSMMEHILDLYTRLKLRGGDFEITYQFLEQEQCLRLEVRPTNEWSQLAFKTIHEREIEDDAKKGN